MTLIQPVGDILETYVWFCFVIPCVFPAIFLKQNLVLHQKKIPFGDFSLEKMCLISLRALKQQFSKMAVAGNIKVPKLFTQLPLLQKTLKILA